MPYRSDPEARERERAALIQRIRELEERWTAAFWARIAPARGLTPPTPDLGAAPIAALADRALALQRAEEDRAAIVRAWRERPHPPRSPDSVDLDRIEEWPTRREVLGAWFAGGRRSPWIPEIALRIREATSHLDVDLCVSPTGEKGAIGARFDLAIGCARGLAPLRVRGDELIHDLAALVGLGVGIDLGDPDFDGVFRVTGDRDTARAVLDHLARRALVRLGAEGSARVDLEDGAARVGTIVCRAPTGHALALAAATVVLERIAAAEPPPLRVE